MVYMMSVIDYVRTWFGIGIREEDGQGLIEYVLIGALISIAAIGAMILVGPAIIAKFTEITTGLS